jgi:DNA-binding MarR family transcriptional regulator
MEKEKRFGSMEPFFQGYREQEKQIKTSRPQYKSDEDISKEVLELFAAAGTKSMTQLEIQSWLMVQPIALRRVLKDLEEKKLIQIGKPVEGEILVSLTKSGEQL